MGDRQWENERNMRNKLIFSSLCAAEASQTRISFSHSIARETVEKEGKKMQLEKRRTANSRVIAAE
jgi:hypothetical protein